MEAQPPSEFLCVSCPGAAGHCRNGGFASGRPVRPGDKMTTVVSNDKVGSRLGVFSMKGYVGDELACDCTVKCMLGEK